MLSWIAHYKNKFPGGKVIATETSIDVFDKDGVHAVALRKSGAGQFACESEKFGCSDKHDLAPIPKDSRVHKVVDKCVSLDDKASERLTLKDKFLCSEGKKILSVDELSKKGFEFDEKQRLVKSPSQL